MSWIGRGKDERNGKSKRREDILGCNLIKRARLDHLAAVSSPTDRKTPQRDSPGHLRLLVRCVRCSVHLRHCPRSAQARFPRQQPKMQQRDDAPTRFQCARHSNMSSAYVRGAGAGYERVRVCYVDVQLGVNSGLWLGSGVGEEVQEDGWEGEEGGSDPPTLHYQTASRNRHLRRLTQFARLIPRSSAPCFLMPHTV